MNLFFRLLILFLILCLLRLLVPHFIYESTLTMNADSPLYFAVGRGILNGLIPYRDLFETKAPGIFLLTALSLKLNRPEFLNWVFTLLAFSLVPLSYLLSKLVQENTKLRSEKNYLRLGGFLISSCFLILYGFRYSEDAQIELLAAPLAMWAVYFSYLSFLVKKKQLNLYSLAAAVFLAFACFVKEPFAFSFLAALLLLPGFNFLRFKKIVLICCAALLVFTGMLGVSGYLDEYVGIYLPHILNQRVDSSKLAPFLRAFDFRRIYFLLNALVSFFGFYIFFLIIYSWFRPFFDKTKSYSVKFSNLAVSFVAFYLAFLSASLVNPSYPHHTVMLLPFYFILCLQFWYSIKEKGVELKLKFMFVGLLFPYMLYSFERIDFARKQTYFTMSLASAQTDAKVVDELLDACHVDRYQFIGGNFLQVYAFTKHSPLGPVFFQLPFFPNVNDSILREAFWKQLQAAQIVVYKKMPSFHGSNHYEEYFKANFSNKDVPECAKSLVQNVGPHLKESLYFRLR